MTISSHVEFATEELAHSYMPYLAEEGQFLTLDGFKTHVRDNIVGLQESGIRHSDDAYALAYYKVMEEGWDDIVANWTDIVAEAQALREEAIDTVIEADVSEEDDQS